MLQSVSRLNKLYDGKIAIKDINFTKKKGEIIGKVGPKNVYGVTNNPYKDGKGNPTNRSYNRLSLSFYY